jgi:diguanylate cyclase (GGDEF)-like protein
LAGTGSSAHSDADSAGQKLPRRSLPEKPTTTNASRPELPAASRNDREIRGIRILLVLLVLIELISVAVPKGSNPLRVEIDSVPQLLIGFVFLALIVALHLASQHKLVDEVSTALIAANSYVKRLEQLSLIDPPTQLFNRRCLDQLFNQQLKWLYRSGKPATLLMLEVLPAGRNVAAEEIVIEAAFVLRTNFRGSDYVVRYSNDQFLVVLPDTFEQQAQIALSRLIDKVDHWNLANEKCTMALRLELCTCPPGGNLWEKLGELEERMRSESGGRRLIPQKPASDGANDPCPQEHVV